MSPKNTVIGPSGKPIALISSTPNTLLRCPKNSTLEICSIDGIALHCPLLRAVLERYTRNPVRLVHNNLILYGEFTVKLDEILESYNEEKLIEEATFEYQRPAISR